MVHTTNIADGSASLTPQTSRTPCFKSVYNVLWCGRSLWTFAYDPSAMGWLQLLRPGLLPKRSLNETNYNRIFGTKTTDPPRCF